MLEALQRAGYESDAALTRVGWLAHTSAELERMTGAPPAWRWFVPGRIEIFGKHTDYAGGRSLLAAVPRGFAVAAAPRHDRLVRVVDAILGQTVLVDPSDKSAGYPDWSRYAATVVHRLNLNFPGANLGADITVASDLPRAAGLSSSSALMIAIATALIRRAGLMQRPEWTENIRTPFDRAGYFGVIENGAGFG